MGYAAMTELVKTERSFGRVAGVSPAEHKFYVLAMFDISDRKKYTLLVKLLKRYGYRIQNSVFEGHLKMADYKDLVAGVDKLMRSKRYFDEGDRVRIYRVSSACDAVIFGTCDEQGIDLDENLFI